MLNFTAQGIKTLNWVTQQKFISNLTKKNSSLSCKTFSQVLERKYETDSKTTENWIIKSFWNLRLTPLFIVFRGCLSNKETNSKNRKLQRRRKQNKITHKFGQIIYSIREEIAQIFEGEFRIQLGGHVAQPDWQWGEKGPRVARGMVKLAGGWRQLGPAEARWRALRKPQVWQRRWGTHARNALERAGWRACTGRAPWILACRWRAQRGVGKAGELGPTRELACDFGSRGSLYTACAARLRLTRLWA